MYLIILILHDSNLLSQVLAAWDGAGVSGITIIPSTGLGRLQQDLALKEDFPLFPQLSDIFCFEERMNRTLITAVKTEEMTEKVVEATQTITGDLDNPNTGVLLVLPVLKAYGLNRRENLS